MVTTERDRLELYELAKQGLGARFAELFMSALPPDPHDVATTQDLALTRAELRTEMAELRTDLRTEMAELRTELRTEMVGLRLDVGEQIHSALGTQTRTLLLGLVGSVTALTVTELLVGAFG